MSRRSSQAVVGKQNDNPNLGTTTTGGQGERPWDWHIRELLVDHNQFLEDLQTQMAIAEKASHTYSCAHMHIPLQHEFHTKTLRVSIHVPSHLYTHLRITLNVCMP